MRALKRAIILGVGFAIGFNAVTTLVTLLNMFIAR